jgi:hypothetical protein
LLQQRKRHVVVAAAGPGAGKGGSSGEDEIWQHLSQMADKYLFASGEPVVPPCAGRGQAEGTSTRG